MDILGLITPMCAHGVDATVWATLLEQAMPNFGVVTPVQVAAFLSNVVHETGGFVELTENLNYSWTALLAQWGTHFTVVDAIRFGRVDAVSANADGSAYGVLYKGTFYPTTVHPADQQSIANTAYTGRLGNVNYGDGWRYRGRGCFNITGGLNYRAYASACGRPQAIANPDLVALPQDAVLSSCWYWKSNGLDGVLATRGFTAVRIEVNGGTIGLQDAINDFNRITAALAA
jgi:putative chitinase